MDLKLPANLLLLACLSATSMAQQMSTDEQAIREEIAAVDNRIDIDTRHTEDIIYWPGSFKRPMIGRSGDRVLMPGVSARVSSRSKTTVHRLEVASSGDMAWEFSDAEVTVEEKESDGKNRTRTFTTSQLRVWKKVDGRWKAAAHFQFPHQN